MSKTETDVQKLEQKCPFYKELDTLFRNRQNINPHSVVEPIQIPKEPLQNDEENLISSSLESVHITDTTRKEGTSTKKRKAENHVNEPESPRKKKENSSEESPFNSNTSSGNNGKNNFTNSYVANQKERFRMEKEIKEEELKLQKELKN